MRFSRLGAAYLVAMLSMLLLLPALAPAQASTDAPDQSKFLRFIPDKNGGGSLQASVVRYENEQGVTVDSGHDGFLSLDCIPRGNRQFPKIPKYRNPPFHRHSLCGMLRRIGKVLPQAEGGGKSYE